MTMLLPHCQNPWSLKQSWYCRATCRAVSLPPWPRRQCRLRIWAAARCACEAHRTANQSRLCTRPVNHSQSEPSLYATGQSQPNPYTVRTDRLRWFSRTFQNLLWCVFHDFPWPCMACRSTSSFLTWSTLLSRHIVMEHCTNYYVILHLTPRLRNDLYCAEWDVKLYYTIPLHLTYML